MSQRYPAFSFSFKRSSSSKARIGEIHTPHGIIKTPAFIFCATKATLKSVPIEFLKPHLTQIILSNTYHLMLQPGADVIEKMGGIHRFCGWDGPMLTDSGGFQIFSLGHGSVADEIKGRRERAHSNSLLKITEEGALFKSYTNGKRELLTPERSIQTQVKIGADLIVVLDECTPFHVDKMYTKKSMGMSHRWALRSLAEFDKWNKGKQALYGIIQGGIHEDLRTISTTFVNEQDFFGHAIGGSLGASKEQMYDIVHFTTTKLRADRPIHLLGIGGIRDIFSGVEAGIDTFDCVHPTRLARHGGALVKEMENQKEHLNLRNARFQEDPAPIEENCPCSTCRTYSRAYLHHLLKAKELLAYTLLSVHNIYVMNQLMAEIRDAIESNTLEALKKKWLAL